jgi:hypothetical protein
MGNIIEVRLDKVIKELEKAQSDMESDKDFDRRWWADGFGRAGVNLKILDILDLIKTGKHTERKVKQEIPA